MCFSYVGKQKISEKKALTRRKTLNLVDKILFCDPKNKDSNTDCLKKNSERKPRTASETANHGLFDSCAFPFMQAVNDSALHNKHSTRQWEKQKKEKRNSDYCNE